VVRVTDDLKRLARFSPDASAHRSDEPYRLALSRIYDRLSATAWALCEPTGREPIACSGKPYDHLFELARDLETITESLRRHGSERVARGRLRLLQRAVQLFGFHLAPLDLRQHSAVQKRVVADLFKVGARREGYELLAESERQRWLIEELTVPRLLRSPHVSYSRETESELKIFDAAAELQRRYGEEALPTTIVSTTTAVSYLLEAAALLKEAGLLRPPPQPRLALNIVPLFETIASLRDSAPIMVRYSVSPCIGGFWPAAAIYKKSCWDIPIVIRMAAT
jgi:phosphoenolpyruvate carboxylase